MNKIIWGFISIALLLVVLYFGYSTIRTLNGNPLNMSKAEELAVEYIKQEYPNENLLIGEGTYAKNYDNFYYKVEGSAGVVNELVIQDRLKTIEDTNLSKELNTKVRNYLPDESSLSIQVNEVNGTVNFTTDDFYRKDTIWITLSGEDVTNEEIASLGKGITNWSEINGLSLNKLIIDFTNLTSNESFRLSVSHSKLESQDYVTMIEKIG
ncbi:YfjL-like protein [Bacillus sp. AK128]